MSNSDDVRVACSSATSSSVRATHHMQLGRHSRAPSPVLTPWLPPSCDRGDDTQRSRLLVASPWLRSREPANGLVSTSSGVCGTRGGGVVGRKRGALRHCVEAYGWRIDGRGGAVVQVSRGNHVGISDALCSFETQRLPPCAHGRHARNTNIRMTARGVE